MIINVHETVAFVFHLFYIFNYFFIFVALVKF